MILGSGPVPLMLFLVSLSPKSGIQPLFHMQVCCMGDKIIFLNRTNLSQNWTLILKTTSSPYVFYF